MQKDIIKALRCVDMLNELAAKSKHGIHPVSQAKEGARGLLYDDSCLLSKEEIPGTTYYTYPLISSFFIDESRRRIVSYWADAYAEESIPFYVVVDSDGSAYVKICLSRDYNDAVIVESGRWYFV